MEQAQGRLNRPDVTLLNLDDRFCDEEWRYPILGDVVAYRDYSHLSAEFAKLLIPAVIPAVEDSNS